STSSIPSDNPLQGRAVIPLAPPVRRSTMLMKHTLMGAAVALALSAGSALAAVSADEAARLGSTLTPFGAEKAGNADGSIPEWAGGITQAPAGYKGSGQQHIDPFPDDKPLFTITKAN